MVPFKIQTYDTISTDGLNLFPRAYYELSTFFSSPDVILLRSFSLHDYSLPSSLRAIARAGVGVNNIPIEKCTEAGIVVFNTPGANANAVKELVVAGLLLASRKIVQGISWTKTLTGADVLKQVEQGKSNFNGSEINGKTIGVVGLGAIGLKVAHAAMALGMRVIGFDPHNALTKPHSPAIEVTEEFAAMLPHCDYLSLHVPLTQKTRNIIDATALDQMKPGVRLINFGREELIEKNALLTALNAGKVAVHVTDFPEEDFLHHESIIAIPHLGASTVEAERDCAMMAVKKIRDYLEDGTITDSINFPNAYLPRQEGKRITIAHTTAIALDKFITTLTSHNKKIIATLTQQRNGLAYTMLDIVDALTDEQLEQIRTLQGVITIRVLPPKLNFHVTNTV